MDKTCNAWTLARQCVYLPGGACEGLEDLDLSYTMTEGQCPEKSDEPTQIEICKYDVCKIDLTYYRKMNEKFEKIGGFVAPEIAVQADCQADCRALGTCGVTERMRFPPTHCCGEQHKVFKYSPVLKTCSGRDLIYPDINACKNVTFDLVIVVDTAGRPEEELVELRHYIEKFITYIGVLPEGDNIHVAIVESSDSARVAHGFSHNLADLKLEINNLQAGTVRNLNQGLLLASSL